MTRRNHRLLMLLLAAVCLAMAVGLAPPPPSHHTSVVNAVGGSMGGLRVMVIDAFFLRAEGLRRSGRTDDAAALYQTVLDLDPANEAASVFLANLYIDDLMPQVTDVEGRLRWWKEARALLDRALARRPDSPRLHARVAFLIMDASFADPRLEDAIRKELGRPLLVALRHLRRAVRGADTLPSGRGHLVRIVPLAPIVAADALRDGDRRGFREAVDAATEARRVRGATLDRMPLDEEHDANLGQLLDLGRATVKAAAAVVWDDGDREVALELLEAYRAVMPESRMVRVLEGVLRP